MKINQFLLTGTVALIITSCSQNDDFSPEPIASSPINTTFSVSADAERLSRAGTDIPDAAPSRAFMYIKDNTNNAILQKAMPGNPNGNLFEFSLELDRSHTYTIAFWADAGGYEIDSTAGLESIKYSDTANNSPSIAYAQCNTCFKPSESTATITLQHAVAKLVIRESSVINVDDRVNVTFTRKNYSYSAVSQSYKTESENTTVSLEKTVDSSTQSGDIISAYMLAPNDSYKAGNDPSMLVDDFCLTYTPKGETTAHRQTISNVSFKANHRTIIEGNIMSLSKVSQSFSVSINTGWNDNNTPGIGDETPVPGPGDEPQPTVYPEITLTTAGTLTEAKLIEAIGSGNSLKISGSMNDADFKVLRTYLASDGNGSDKQLALNLENAGITALPNLAFCTQLKLDDFYGKENPNPISGLKEILLPDGLTKISDGAFADCINLTDVTIPSSVTELGEMAFYRSGITELLASSVSVVGGNACDNCKSLRYAVLGNLTKILDCAFKACTEMETMDITRTTAVPATMGNDILGGAQYPTPNLTIYVSSQAILEALSTSTKWKLTNPKWAVGTPPNK